ncbi:hypothetical protein SAMN06265337_1453 [Hymenobacter gelipurpurascens]|uniref:STAS/SEC14 domain-containing protein n=1 Tax=Hymenobacter gelipurpurascens TaxID=89968 RepID=A0A212TJG8_9BACT|nr:hypothetical protein [Hymenobacter gelipurpurascens]SNC65971.1 hypothetical protein SAMN06265337_1453 [Hymenobacter gelipurpurascens]
MPLFDSNYLTITYTPESQQLTGRWLRSVMPFELHRGYNTLLDSAVERNCRFWLIDIRRRSSVESRDVYWMLEEFYPQLFPRLGRTTYIAFLMAPNQLAGVLADSKMPVLETPEDGKPYIIQRFTEEKSAQDWLHHYQQHESVAR